MADLIDRVVAPIVDRMVERVRITRQETIARVLGENRQTQGHLDKALPDLQKTLGSRPDLLRLIMEVYSYLQDEGETLSQAVIELQQAKKATEAAMKLAKDGKIDLASVETYLMAIRVYLQSEPATIKDVLHLFDLAPLEEALGEIRLEQPKRFEELHRVFEVVKGKEVK